MTDRIESGERRADEQARIVAEYRRRDAVASNRYAADDPVVMLERAGRRTLAERLLREAGQFPSADSRCLEVGCGAIGWGGELRNWGVRPNGLHGIDMSQQRIDQARLCLVGADLRVGDASALPWGEAEFELVIASTLFTSVLAATMRREIATEMVRVMKPGGALLWYDFAFNNPRNPQVKKVTRRELHQLFPQLHGEVRSVTLAPPIARLVTPLSPTLASVLARLRPLQTHLLGVLIKPH